MLLTSAKQMARPFYPQNINDSSYVVLGQFVAVGYFEELL
jgi:hypothetical protein